MPAKNTHRVDKEGAYFHVYNRGVAKRNIFRDDKDYLTFLEFLKDYLTSPHTSEKTKKTFTVKGKTFKGVPHQPKNYFDKINLVAYNLAPNHFHLLIHQVKKGALEKFIRSLCTRYSMYFNKKYNRTGSLFEGPYKSVHVKSFSDLLLLTHYLFNNHQKGVFSSYEEFVNKRTTSWVKSKTVISYFQRVKTRSFKGVKGYKGFVEEYKPSNKEKEALERILIEDPTDHLEGIDQSLERIDANEKTPQKARIRVSGFVAAIAVFLLLLTLGFRNVSSSNKKESIAASPAPAVSGVETTTPKITLAVSTGNKDATVNIREQPSISSKTMAQVKEGDMLEFIASDMGWYKVKLEDNTTGYILAAYTQIIENE